MAGSLSRRARRIRRGTRRAFTGLTAALLMLAGLVGIASQGASPTAAAPGGVIYDSIPVPTQGNYPSQPFQAQQTAEFGDKVTMASAGALGKAKILMSSWACQSGDWTGGCTTTPGTGFSHPITFNVYAPSAGPSGVGALLLSKTQAFTIPFRPSADPTNCPATPTQWYSVADNACYNGFATPIEFDLSSTPQPVLPATIIWTVSFNTQSYGASPLGVDGPYNSLNVALNDDTGPTVGTDVDPTGVFFSTQTAGLYCDSGTGGSGFLRSDPGCWAPYVPAAQLTQLDLPTISIGNILVKEGDSGTTPANVPVTLSHPYPSPVTVKYATATGGAAQTNQRATSGPDYPAKTGTVTFPANTTSATIPLLVNGGTTLEQNETFLVNLSNPTNATLTMAQSGVVTIGNDELPVVLVNGVPSNEGTTTPFTITLKQTFWTTLTLNAATVGNTAASPGDFTAVNTNVSFPLNDVGPKTVNVTVKTDGLAEPGETFYLQVNGGSAPSSAQSRIRANKT